MKQFKLLAHRGYGRTWFTLTDPDCTAFEGQGISLGVVSLPVDENEVESQLDAFDEEAKEAKRAALLAELAALDGEKAA